MRNSIRTLVSKETMVSQRITKRRKRSRSRLSASKKAYKMSVTSLGKKTKQFLKVMVIRKM